MSKMDAIIHDMEVKITLGDKIIQPAFQDNADFLGKFDFVVSNHMWNQDISQSIQEIILITDLSMAIYLLILLIGVDSTYVWLFK